MGFGWRLAMLVVLSGITHMAVWKITIATDEVKVSVKKKRSLRHRPGAAKTDPIGV
jgi:hypothetical protein